MAFTQVPSWLISHHLDQTLVVALEVAVELWLALTESTQTQWCDGPGGNVAE